MVASSGWVSVVTAATESEREKSHSRRGVIVSVTAMTTMGHNTESQNYSQPSSSRSATLTTSRSAVNFLTDGNGGMVGGIAAMATHQNRSSLTMKGSSDGHGLSSLAMEQHPLNVLLVAAVHGGLWWSIAAAERDGSIRWRLGGILGLGLHGVLWL
ncbi:unnamed protein product [Lactuca saligna]|uniref:Uncharacterized protein n=1 Tax=Lactuca saligna TaxID=75948 RepID=A0AA35YK57_LACSI|nr:unnamed protein product [Lactuca saligna]